MLNELKSQKDKEKQSGKAEATTVEGVADLILIAAKQNELTKTRNVRL